MLRVVPATIHIPLAEVPRRPRPRAAARDDPRSPHAALVRDFGIAAPRIAVAGLNPHAGEGGVMGREEIETIAPVIAALRAEGMDASGPLPADTMFHAAARARYDAAVCMYHDQALIPIKTLDFARRRERDAGPALRAHLARPRHRLRHRRDRRAPTRPR